MLRLTLRCGALCVSLQGAVIIPIVMYVDGTWLSANGAHTAKPFLMAIGNHPIDVQHDLRSKKVWCGMCSLGILRLALFCVDHRTLCSILERMSVV